MKEEPKFNVLFAEEVLDFLNKLDNKAKNKILYNIAKAQYVTDPELFKNLENSEIWEFRTLYNRCHYRLLSFWDNNEKSFVIITHGFIKKFPKHHAKK